MLVHLLLRLVWPAKGQTAVEGRPQLLHGRERLPHKIGCRVSIFYVRGAAADKVAEQGSTLRVLPARTSSSTRRPTLPRWAAIWSSGLRRLGCADRAGDPAPVGVPRRACALPRAARAKLAPGPSKKREESAPHRCGADIDVTICWPDGQDEGDSAAAARALQGGVLPLPSPSPGLEVSGLAPGARTFQPCVCDSRAP
ncbi:unnamed protein product [Prorocentrum cordatum]|uniref:ASPIC/UnbV domain-containing protein n=1 Tax=Prorocentrum cordatum TaxID=2364126 RepID=A0ABN9W8P9_9DINO|nr:unnamed protein product [Polarella glacialis]